jgi:C4-dicarboxylate-specific signal transduction histidine kinase
VVHEINNPLSFVRSNLDFLEREVLCEAEPSREELAEVFSETRAGVERIRQIVSDLRGFSHMGREELAECALTDVVSDATRLARLRLKHVARVEVDIPEDVPAVRANHRRLAQVLLNLLVNAGDALQARGQRDSELRISARREGARALLVVEDNGPGFPPEVLPHLFEPFFTTKGPESGTGLGLALARELVQQCGGTLVAENRPEGGARLRLELPVHGPGERAAAAA